MERLQRITILKGFMKKEAEKDKEIRELKEQLAKLKQELQKKEALLQSQPPPPPLNIPKDTQQEFDTTPMDLEMPSMSDLGEPSFVTPAICQPGEGGG